MLRRSISRNQADCCVENCPQQNATKENGAESKTTSCVNQSSVANNGKFQTELQIHSKMKHTNIVQFHRAFSFQHSTYIVLELCPNGSLMDMVKKRRFVTEPEVRYWTIQMAGAIKYMHAKGIIHRDLKMGNIFLDKDMNIKVGDFGLAAMLLSNKDMTTIRRTTLCGTPNYIAPEILEKGKQGHDQAVDIWSLGIIMLVEAISCHSYNKLIATDLLCLQESHHFNQILKTRSTDEHESENMTGLVWTRLIMSSDKKPRTS